MPWLSSAAVICPVRAGSRPEAIVEYDGWDIIRNSRNATTSAPTVLAPSAIRWRVFMARNAVMAQLDLGVEDVVYGLDDLGADLGGELHRQPRALDGEHRLGRVRRGPGRKLLGGLSSALLLLGE